MRALLALAWTALAVGQPSSVDWELRVVRCGGAGAPTLREAAGVVPVTRVGAESAARQARCGASPSRPGAPSVRRSTAIRGSPQRWGPC